MKYLLIIALLLEACGTQTKATPYAELTPTEEARIALNAQDFSKAINLYKAVLASHPDDYESARFLSAAYAGLGEFDILKAVAGTLSKSSDSLLAMLGNLVPAQPTDVQIEALRLAKDTLLALPEEQRSHDHPEIPSSSSAAQQLEFYQAAYSVIYLNKFSQVTDTGALDPAKLETMTDADVDAIVDNFAALAASGGGGVVTEGAGAFIEKLDSTPGGTRKEKLLAYLATQSH